MDNDLRVVTYNINKGAGMNRGPFRSLFNVFYSDNVRYNLDKIGLDLRGVGADIAILQEVPEYDFGDRLVKGAEHIAQMMRADHLYYGPLRWRLNNRFIKWAVNIAIISKYPFYNGRNMEFDYDGLEYLSERKNFVDTTINLGSEKIDVVGLHLESDVGPAGEYVRRRQFRQLTDFVSKKPPKGIILAGDLNDCPERARMLHTVGLKNPVILGVEEDDYTFPAKAPREVIDYIFASNWMKFKDYKTPKWEHSDHLPVLADLYF